jgi:hypothetical protein
MRELWSGAKFLHVRQTTETGGSSSWIWPQTDLPRPGFLEEEC